MLKFCIYTEHLFNVLDVTEHFLLVRMCYYFEYHNLIWHYAVWEKYFKKES